MKNLNKVIYIDLVLFYVLGILMRVPFLEKMHSHWDGPQYTIAIVRYSLENHTPAPPGYPIYIALGKIAHVFISDLHTSILMVSLIGGGIGAAFFYILGLKFFNRYVGIISALLFLTGPVFFFFGITANPYGLLPITAGALALTVLQIKRKNKHGVLLGVIYAISVGIRPQDAIFLTPLFIYGLLLSNKKNKIYAIFSFISGLLIWMLPLFYAAGGLNNYISLLKNYQETALTGFSINHLFRVWFIMVKGMFLSFTIASLFLIPYLFDLFKFLRIKNKTNYILKNDYIIIFILWIFPSLLFNAFVRSDHAAHQMTYISAFLVLISYSMWRIFKFQTNLLWLVVASIVLFNLFTFFRDRDPEMKKTYISQSYHYSEIRKNNIRMKAKVNYIQKNYNPQTTLIVTTEEMFRPYTYYLKDFRILAINALANTDLPYSNYRSEGKSWNMIQSYSEEHSIKIPENITKIVFIDDASSSWLKNQNFKKHKFPANSSIIEITRGNNTNLEYSFHHLNLN